jgi:UDP-2,3-diacylglucosamine pyrophosphatase LpxH
MQNKLHHKTIVLSDLHLGSKWSKASELLDFLKKNSCDTLILCGDIIDGWSILRGSNIKWRRIHTNVMKYILSMSDTTKIIYIRGNHDDFLDRVQPLVFANISIVKDYVYESFGKRYLVIHGDEFDNITTNWKWLSKLGDIGYSLLLHLNSFYNKWRSERNQTYKSISSIIKQKVKSSISYIGDYENHLTNVAGSRKCDGVICGHIHHPENKYIGDLLYLNSGDWIESLSAVTEEYDGTWQIIYYHATQSIEDNSSRTSLQGARVISVPATI